MLTPEERDDDLADVLAWHRIERLGPLPGAVKCKGCENWETGTIWDHHAALAREHVGLTTLRQAIDFAHEEQRQGVSMGRSEETMTLFQHWSATAGWLASRIRAIERGEEPDWPDAMNAAPVPGGVAARKQEAGCECPPCPGRGNDGHGLTHCAECCMGAGVVADLDCPVHGLAAYPPAVPADGAGDERDA